MKPTRPCFYPSKGIPTGRQSRPREAEKAAGLPRGPVLPCPRTLQARPATRLLTCAASARPESRLTSRRRRCNSPAFFPRPQIPGETLGHAHSAGRLRLPLRLPERAGGGLLVSVVGGAAQAPEQRLPGMVVRPRMREGQPWKQRFCIFKPPPPLFFFYFQKKKKIGGVFGGFWGFF